MDTTSSYVTYGPDGHCALLGGDPGHSCWGRVKVVDTIGEDREGEVAYNLLACEGHFNKIKYGFRANYKKEPTDGSKDT